MLDRITTPQGDRQLNFAVFGDIHGRIALMYTLAILWQQESGIELDGLLQVGDFGAFPDLLNLDKATRKHAQKDTDELGFQDFYIVTSESKFYLEHKYAPPTYFVRGNHEDFDYLKNFIKPSPLDPWQKIWYIPDCQTLEIERENFAVKIAAFGGIAPRQEKPARGKLAREQYRQAQKIGKSEPRFFREDSIECILIDLQGTDILMTHAGPYSPDLPTGSTLLARLARQLQPRVHLFGHHHRVIDRQNSPNGSLSIGLEHLEFDRHGKVKQGSWGILSISPESLGFTFMSPDIFPIFKKIERNNYRSLVE
jgi:predicted phosphodiesterase